MTKSETPTRKLTRSSTDTVIAGVAGGLAEYLNIDSTVVRVIFIILTFAGGFGVLLYVILALVIPPATTQPEPASAFDKKVADLHEEVKQKAKEWKEQVGAKPRPRRSRSVVGWILLIVGAFILLDRLDIVDTAWTGTYWPVLLIVGGLLFIAAD